MIGPKKSLILERSVQTSDSQGGFTSVWASIHQFTGSFYSTSDLLPFQHGKFTSETTHVFNISTNSQFTVSKKDRFRLYERVFIIEEILPIRDFQLQIGLKEVK